MATKIYTVKTGDSLSKIARDTLGNMQRWKEIAFINSLSYPYIIKVGEIIQLPDNNEVIEINKTPKPAPVSKTANSLSPATVILLLAGAAFFILN